MTSDQEPLSSAAKEDLEAPGLSDSGPAPLSPTFRGISRSRRRWWLQLVAIVLLALAVRLVVALPFAEAEPRGDEAYYLRVAASLVAGDGHPGSVRPPLYPALLALGLQLGQERGAQLLQLSLSLALVLLLADTARRRFGTVAAVGTGLSAALMPALAHYAHFYWSEGLNAFLIALWLWALTRWEERADSVSARPWLAPSWLAPSWLALSASVLAWAALTRESWLFFALPFALWVAVDPRWRRDTGSSPNAPPSPSELLRIRPPRRGLLTAGLLLILVAAWITPWALRNSKLHGELVLVSTNRWFPIAVGNLLPADDWIFAPNRAAEVKKELPQGLSELDSERWWRDVAIQAIAQEQPWWLGKKLIRNGGRLISLHSQAVRFLERGWIAPPPPAGRALIAYDVAAYLGLAIFGLAGLWLIPDPRLKSLAVGALLYTAAVHLLANAIPRFHVPVLPILCLYAGPLLAAPKSVWKRAAPWRKQGAAGTLILFLVLVLHRAAWALEGAWKATAAP
ncbi:MAG: glycosyltransferase family 39 protein [Acidobacteriota bacterium]